MITEGYRAEINGATKLLGVIGHNISYTLSPLIHNVSAAKLGLNYVYVPIEVSEDALERTLSTMWEIGAIGFNVTSPYKAKVAKILKSDLSSVNTIFRGKNSWEASSTDAQGFATALDRLGTHLYAFRRIIILGAGGAVSALLEYISQQFDKHPEITVLRRSPQRDQFFSSLLPSSFKVRWCDFDARVFAELISGAAGETLVIQATSAPLHGDDLKRFAEPMARFNGVFSDLVYGTPSALYDAAKERGIPCQDGLAMLIEQARLSQKFWWGQCALFDDIYAFLQNRVPQKPVTFEP